MVFLLDFGKVFPARLPGRAARVLVTTTANMEAVMMTEKEIVILIDGGTEIGKDPESIGKELVIVRRGESVIVTGIDVTENGDTVTVTRETEIGERSGRLVKIGKSPKNNEKRKDTARTQVPKPQAGLKRENWYQARKRVEGHVSRKRQRTKILNPGKRVSGPPHPKHVMHMSSSPVTSRVILRFEPKMLLLNVFFE